LDLHLAYWMSVLKTRPEAGFHLKTTPAAALQACQSQRRPLVFPHT
jgi:hypothetical protein